MHSQCKRAELAALGAGPGAVSSWRARRVTGFSSPARPQRNVRVWVAQATETLAGRDGTAQPAASEPAPPSWMTETELPQYDPSIGRIELVIAGAGPSGLAVADRVSQAGVFLPM